MKKNAVVILYSPRGLLEFLWYFCTYGKEYNWIAVCAWYGNMARHQVEVCRKLGIFSRICFDDRNFMDMDILKKIKLFFEMGFYFLIGQRKKMCRRIIQEAIGDIDYELAVISCDYGILPGAFLAEAKEKRIVILEDGVGDYMERYKYPRFRSMKSINDLAGFFLAKMGYANTAFCYAMRDSQFCEKFSIYPEKLKYRDYKSIQKLGDMDHERFDRDLYQVLKSEVINAQEEYTGDAVLFTTTFYGVVKEHDIVVSEAEKYINKNYAGKTLLLKKHPRDEHKYVFDSRVNVVEIDKNLPAEILEEKLKVGAYIYMYPSNTMLTYQKYVEQIYVLYFRILEKTKTRGFNYKENFKRGLKVCKIKEENIKVI